MFNLFGKKKEDPLTELQKSRQRLIDELLKSVPSCRLIISPTTNPNALINQNESKFTVYEAAATTVYGRLPFHILLPHNFPERPPIFQLTNYFNHRWLVPIDLSVINNNNGSNNNSSSNGPIDPNLPVVLHPKLGSWTVNSSLAALVIDIVNEFSRNPPTPASNPFPYANNNSGNVNNNNQNNSSNNSGAGYIAPSYRAPIPNPNSNPNPSLNNNNNNNINNINISPSPNANAMMNNSLNPNVNNAVNNNSQPRGGSGSFSNNEHNALPKSEIPRDFPILDTYPISELQNLISNPILISCLAHEDPLALSIRKNFVDKMASVASLSEKNVEMINELNKKKENLARLNQKALLLNQKYIHLREQYSSFMEQFQLNNILNGLNKSIESSEKESDAIKENFQKIQQLAPEGDQASMYLNLAEQFLKSRTVFHLKQAKKERLIDHYGQRS